jgi:hypothetical protein
MQSWYLLCYSKPLVGQPFGVRRRLLKNPVFIYCDCFRTFVGGGNFVGKDVGKLLNKTLSEVPNIRNVHNYLSNYNLEVKIKYLNYETVVEHLERRQYLLYTE